MSQRTLWIVTAVLLLVYITVYPFAMPSGRKGDWFDLIVAFLFVFAAGALLAAILSVFPQKGKSYLERFKVRLPIGISVLSVLLTVLFAFTLYQWKKSGIIPGKPTDYNEAKAYSDCSSLRTGMFEDESMIIERADSLQRQTIKKTGKVEKYKIEWRNECEYELWRVSDNVLYVKVKVTSVTDSGFICVVSQGQLIGREYTYRRK